MDEISRDTQGGSGEKGAQYGEKSTVEQVESPAQLETSSGETVGDVDEDPETEVSLSTIMAVVVSSPRMMASRKGKEGRGGGASPAVKGTSADLIVSFFPFFSPTTVYRAVVRPSHLGRAPPAHRHPPADGTAAGRHDEHHLDPRRLVCGLGRRLLHRRRTV